MRARTLARSDGARMRMADGDGRGRRSMKRIGFAPQVFLALALPYFRVGDDRWAGRAMVAGVVALEFALVYVAVLVNQWHGRFFNALDAGDWAVARAELAVFGLIVLLTIATGAAQFWFGQHFQIRWRRWMTNRFAGLWLDRGRHYRLPFVAGDIDNAQLRIVQDIGVFIQKTHEVGAGFIGVVITLATFSVILWGLSATAPLPVNGVDLSFPGYLIVVALLYSTIGTLLAHVIGHRLVRLNFNQQRREADIRYATTRALDNSEQIALLGNEPVERAEIRRRVDNLVGNWTVLTAVQTRLTGFIYGYNQVSAVFPILVVSPAYLAGAITLGALMQAAAAFQRMESGFSFLITSYSRIAEWKAAMDRIAQLETALANCDRVGFPGAAIVLERGDGDRVTVGSLLIRTPSGKAIAEIKALSLGPGDRLLVAGNSGSGKSSVIRALAGIWPFGEGRIVLPGSARILTLPSRPYFPLGSLRQVVSAPAVAGEFADAEICAALAEVGLGHLGARLDEERDWPAALSGGDQQRVSFARALVHRPDILVMDNIASEMPEDDARSLYADLIDKLPEAIVVMTSAAGLDGQAKWRTLALEPPTGRHAPEPPVSD